MSFVITLYVREGIVLASDSRLTLNSTREEDDKRIVQLAVGETDSVYKTFLAPNNIGLSTFGDADIQGVPIAGYVDSFISEKLSEPPPAVDEVPQKLLEYFRTFPGPPNIQFHVAGYKTENGQRRQHVWHVSVSDGGIERKNPADQQGATWGGEADVLARLLQPVGVIDSQGKLVQSLPYHKVPWQFFTLQDAIDFAIFAVRVTIDSLRFLPRPKTVGGPIDVLVIKPNEAFWVQRKELHS